MSRSNSREVTLTNVERETSGEFKCEVSADAPLFHTEIRAAHLLVAGIYNWEYSLWFSSEKFFNVVIIHLKPKENSKIPNLLHLVCSSFQSDNN